MAAVPAAEGAVGGVGRGEVETDAPAEGPAVAVVVVVGLGGLGLAGPVLTEADAVGCELVGAETVAEAEADGPGEVETDADVEAVGGVGAGVGACTLTDADPTGVETGTPIPSCAPLGETAAPSTNTQATLPAATPSMARYFSRTAGFIPRRGCE